jgi:hypothetical protein
MDTRLLIRLWLWCGLTGLLQPVALAQGFAAYVSPPRIELRLQAGERKREVIEIQHAGQVDGRYRFYTNDWAMDSNGGATFSNDLAPGSCRPWVAIERRQLTLAPGARYRYRIEVSAPADSPPVECRFALMVEGQDPSRLSSDLSFPVGGRIAVIVYAAIGAAEPQIQLVAARWENTSQGVRPVLELRNSGQAHARLDGVLKGMDQKGLSSEWVPMDTPILPGEVRKIALRQIIDSDTPSSPPRPVHLPLKLKGALEWGDKKLPIDLTFPP